MQTEEQLAQDNIKLGIKLDARDRRIKELLALLMAVFPENTEEWENPDRFDYLLNEYNEAQKIFHRIIREPTLNELGDWTAGYKFAYERAQRAYLVARGEFGAWVEEHMDDFKALRKVVADIGKKVKLPDLAK